MSKNRYRKHSPNITKGECFSSNLYKKSFFSKFLLLFAFQMRKCLPFCTKYDKTYTSNAISGECFLGG